MAEQQIPVPDIGDFKNVEVIDVLVKVGDRVAIDTPLLTLETEKATMDVPAPVAGVIEKLLVKKGDRVSAGTVVATVQGVGAAPAAVKSAPGAPAAVPLAAPQAALPAPTVAAASAPAPALSPAPAAAINEAGFAVAHASPSVRLLARELGVDLARVHGSGLKGRIVAEDVKAFVKNLLTGAAMAGGGAGAAPAGSALPRVKYPEFSQFGAIELKPLGRIKRISAAHLHASWVNLPHVTQFDEADITDLEAARVRLKDQAVAQGVKLTPLAFVLRAVVRTLQKFPHFNASLDERGENRKDAAHRAGRNHHVSRIHRDASAFCNPVRDQ